MLRPRDFVPAAVLLFGCAFVWNARSQRAMPLAAPLTSILPAIDGYTVLEQKLSDDERRVAGMNDYVARAYRRDSLTAFTTFVSYYERQTQGKTIHSPKNCLPGAGWEILTPGTATLNVDGRQYVVNRVVLKNQKAMAVVYYWYQGRGRVVANEYAVKANLLRDAAIAGHTEEALVRVVVPVIGLDPIDTPAGQANVAAASEMGEEIAVRLEREVARVLPKSA